MCLTLAQFILLENKTSILHRLQSNSCLLIWLNDKLGSTCRCLCIHRYAMSLPVPILALGKVYFYAETRSQSNRTLETIRYWNTISIQVYSVYAIVNYSLYGCEWQDSFPLFHIINQNWKHNIVVPYCTYVQFNKNGGESTKHRARSHTLAKFYSIFTESGECKSHWKLHELRIRLMIMMLSLGFCAKAYDFVLFTRFSPSDDGRRDWNNLTSGNQIAKIFIDQTFVTRANGLWRKLCALVILWTK